jgi:hypothetical protein
MLTASAFLLVCKILDFCSAPRKGAFRQWRKIPPGELSIAPVADERFGWATGWIEAS